MGNTIFVTTKYNQSDVVNLTNQYGGGVFIVDSRKENGPINCYTGTMVNWNHINQVTVSYSEIENILSKSEILWRLTPESFIISAAEQDEKSLVKFVAEKLSLIPNIIGVPYMLCQK